MTISEIAKTIERYTKEGKRLFATSSFQTHSIPLLHIISEIDRSIPIMFIDTGYLFPDTWRFRDEISERFGLKVIDVRSEVPRIHQRDAEGNLYFTSDTDRCCFLNKTQPMENVLREYDVWINGIRADQNLNRRNMKSEQAAPHGCTRYHPVLDWTNKMIADYRVEHDLPAHPMEKKGYLSIGCEPCTVSFQMENERAGRWFGQSKTECGLHTDLVSK